MLLRASWICCAPHGFGADRLDPLTDELVDPQHPDTPYDGIWSCARLFHVVREDLVTVLGRLAEATRSGGRIHVSFKEGDGEVRSTSGTEIGPSATRTRCGGSLTCVRSSLLLDGS